MSGELPGTPVLTRSGGQSAPRRRGSLYHAWIRLAAVVGVGVLAGAVWWWLAPLARTDVSDGSVYLTGHQELQAAQDGWFVVVLGAVGVLTATVNGWRGLGASHHSSSGHLGGRGGHEARRLVVLAAALLLVGAVAWQTGEWLGPADLADQVANGSQHPLTPLRLHSPGALLVGPFLFAFTSFLASLFGGGSGRDG